MNAEENLAEERLESFIDNPGYFSILIIGESGTGKEYLINKVLETKKMSKAHFFQPFEIGDSENEIMKLFSNDIIVIKNIEELTVVQQNILSKALSTSNGEIGIGVNKGLKRILFTSTFDIKQLRDSKEYLSDRFWDRISQLVIKMPSFRDEISNIQVCFNKVWKNMKFKKFDKIPNNGDFIYWLKENYKSFAGNFRDLDKIAILWHQYRLIKYNNTIADIKSEIEAKIFILVRQDFENFNHFPIQKTDTSNVFELEKGKTWEHIERSFHSKFKSWAKKEYKTIARATEMLEMPNRKMDKW